MKIAGVVFCERLQQSALMLKMCTENRVSKFGNCVSKFGLTLEQEIRRDKVVLVCINLMKEVLTDLFLPRYHF